MAKNLASRTVKNHFADICDSIPASGVTTFAGELLQADLICVASHSAAIDVATGLPSSNKISSLVSEVMTRVAGSQDKFAKFVRVETRNLLKSREVPIQGWLAPKLSLPLHVANTVQDMKETKLNHLLQGDKQNESCLLMSMWPSSDKSTEPHPQLRILSPSASTSDKREGKAT